MGARRVRLITRSEKKYLGIFGNSAKLKQVFLNLLENASQHSPENSEILVEVEEQQNNTVIVKVVDRGTGLAPGILPEVFKPFFTTRTRGAGLGLSIVKSIVETHGGKIELLNNDPEPGLTATVSLPLAQEDVYEEKSTAGR